MQKQMQLGKLWGAQSIRCALGLLIYKGFALNMKKNTV